MIYFQKGVADYLLGSSTVLRGSDKDLIKAMYNCGSGSSGTYIRFHELDLMSNVLTMG